MQVVEDAAEDVQDGAYLLGGYWEVLYVRLRLTVFAETIATRSHEIDVDGPAEYYEAQVQRGALKSDDYQRGKQREFNTKCPT